MTRLNPEIGNGRGQAIWSAVLWSFLAAGVALALVPKALKTAGAGGPALPAPARQNPFAVCWNIASLVAQRMSHDNLSLVAAGVAFYAMFAIFPALGALVSIYGLFGDAHVVQTQVQQLTALLPSETGKLLNDALTSLLAKPASSLNSGLLLSLGIAVWGARAGTSSLMAGLNIACEMEEKRSIWLSEGTALGLALGAIVFAIVALTTVAIIPLIISYLPVSAALSSWLNYARWPVLAAFILLALDVIYRYAPSRSAPRWRFLSTGTLLAAALWIAGSWLFSVYVTHFGTYDATYGPLGAVVVLLLWFWLSALIVLLGATVDVIIGELRQAKSA